MIRILQVVRRMNYGGLETLIMNLYRNIDRNKFQFDFIVDKSGKYDKEIKSMGGKIFYLPYITDIGERKYLKVLRTFFKQHSEYKIVHSHLDQVSGIIMEAAFLENVPIRISHSHSTKNSNNLIVKVYKKYLQAKIIKYANNFFACSENAGKWLFKNKINECYILKNGIQTDKFRFSIEDREKIRKAYNIKNDEIVWGHVGRFSREKNHKFLIDSFYEYQKKNHNAKLLLIGEGRLKVDMEKRVEKLGIGNKVVFLGTLSNPEKFYSAFDLMVFPSLYEGLSLVMVEAQVSGLPIIASDTIDKLTDITNTIKFMSIKDGAEDWAQYIEKHKFTRYKKNYDKIVNAGYDIKDISRNLERKYDELLKKVN